MKIRWPWSKSGGGFRQPPTGRKFEFVEQGVLADLHAGRTDAAIEKLSSTLGVTATDDRVAALAEKACMVMRNSKGTRAASIFAARLYRKNVWSFIFPLAMPNGERSVLSVNPKVEQALTEQFTNFTSELQTKDLIAVTRGYRELVGTRIGARMVELRELAL